MKADDAGARKFNLRGQAAWAEQFAEANSGAKALAEKKGFIAALKALRHPKASFSANCQARRLCAVRGTTQVVLFPVRFVSQFVSQFVQ